MSMLEYHSEWLSKHNMKVVIDSKEYIVKVRTYKAISPLSILLLMYMQSVVRKV